ncbi:putative PurR-regulated permease PerM [Methanohalophilus levihalophilus]|uniref:AI-2E family transporter n=1 Tax=Methanohalophilus levihalophilus TaxID=1431282 RepID=UPI001AE82D49|nr:AI-2E family transporter [Methanohalophilus levihalophilus]MBP2031163.1 putative PurR-regulated permease PerM [Methanohalophilus levihalophilus]
MDNKIAAKIAIALLFTGILAYAITSALYPFIEFFLAAIILYTIIDPVYKAILKRTRLNSGIVAIGVIALVILLMIIPIYYLFVLIAAQISQVLANVISQIDLMDVDYEQINELVAMLNLEEKAADIISAAGTFLSGLIIDAVQNIGTEIIGLTILVFLLYYLLTTDDTKLRKIVFDVTPFSGRNTYVLLDEMKNIIHSTVIATLMIAAIQGTLLAITFYLVGIQGALLWGFITAILSIIPVIGAPIIWIPAIIFKIIQADYYAAVAILIAGIIISNVDNFLRPFIQKKVGAIHPFVSLLGIFIGIFLFGLVGIVVGPMLLASFILMLKMFNEEFLQN